MNKELTLKLKLAEKLSLFSSLATMVAAGIPILESANSLLEETNGNQKAFLTFLIKNLEQGKKIADTLQKFPASFDPATVSVIRAAEESGKLEEALKDITINFKKQAAFNEKINSALMYPVLVLIVFFGVMILILTVVMPRVADVFKRLDIDLPLITRILIFLSDILVNNTAVFLFSLVVFVVGGFLIFKWKGSKVKAYILQLPGLRKFGQQVDLAQFSRTLALVLGAGIPITDALKMAHSILLSPQISKAVAIAVESVNSGRSLTDGLQKSPGLFPAVMKRMIESGERSGSLEKSMQEAADYFEEKVEQNVKQMTTLLEPILLVVIGVLVGGMMLAILTPIYGLIGQLGAR